MADLLTSTVNDINVARKELFFQSNLSTDRLSLTMNALLYSV